MFSTCPFSHLCPSWFSSCTLPFLPKLKAQMPLGGLPGPDSWEEDPLLCSGPAKHSPLSPWFYLFGFTRSYLWHVGYLVAACKLLVVVCGIQFPTRDRTHAPCIGSQTLSHWPTKEILLSWSLFPCLLLPLAVSSLDLP